MDIQKALSPLFGRLPIGQRGFTEEGILPPAALAIASHFHIAGADGNWRGEKKSVFENTCVLVCIWLASAPPTLHLFARFP